MFKIPSLLSFKTTAIAAAVSFALGASIATFGLVRWHNDRVDALRLAWTAEKNEAVQDALDALQLQCDAKATLTQETTNALRTDLASLDAAYERLRGQKPIIARCQTLVPPSAGRIDGADAQHGSTGGVGINTEWLDRKFYDANHDALVGAKCQDFIVGLYTLFGQQDKLPTAK